MGEGQHEDTRKKLAATGQGEGPVSAAKKPTCRPLGVKLPASRKVSQDISVVEASRRCTLFWGLTYLAMCSLMASRTATHRHTSMEARSRVAHACLAAWNSA